MIISTSVGSLVPGDAQRMKQVANLSWKTTFELQAPKYICKIIIRKYLKSEA